MKKMKTALKGHGTFGLSAMVAHAVAMIDRVIQDDATLYDKPIAVEPPITTPEYHPPKPHYINQRQRRKLARQNPHSKHNRK